MKNKAFLFVIFLATAGMAMAQPQLPAQVKAKLPEILSSSKLPKMDELQQELCNGSKWGQDKKAVQKLWVVYSDRDDNTTYSSPDKSERFGELKFGEKVCIAEIKGDMALVYIDANARYPDIPNGIKAKGWIPMENLLLWTKCPTDQRGVQKKGIIAINLNKMRPDEKFESKKYNSPDNLNKSTALNTDMNFYYVMKETPDGGYTLLATSAALNNSQALYGWVNKNAYTEWNQRSCLEPNWLQKFVDVNRGQRVYVYEDEGRSSQTTHWEYGTTNGDSNPSYKYRMHKNQLRFPILSQPDDNNMVLCTSFADKTQKSINKAAQFVGSISGQVNERGKQMMQMNVILAVEATSDTKKYLPAIKEALAACKDYANQGLVIQVGLVLYGSMSNGGSGINNVPLSNYDDSRLQGMLNVNQATTRLTGERNVALQQAIEDAISPAKMNFKKGESNMLLVIGYHGTDDALWSEKALLDKLVANDIQLASIQVMRSASGSCNRYNEAMSKLIQKNVEMQYNAIGADAVFQEARNNSTKETTNDGYLFTSSRAKTSGGNPLFASFRYNKVLDQEMQPEALTRYVNNAINGFSKSITASKAIFEETLVNVDFYPAFLKKKLGEKGYNDWLQVKAISAYGGYAHIKDLGDEDNWKAILYLSSDELAGLIANLENISKAAEEGNTDRTIYISAIRELLKRQMGGSITDDEINALSPEELEDKIYGIVNVKSENMRFTKYSLKDLASRKTVSDDDYFDVLDRFVKKYKKLKTFTQGYEYRMDVGGMYYYWIPLDDLP